MKKILLLIALSILTSPFFSQTLFSSSFGNLSLQTYTSSIGSFQYTNTPAIYTLLGDTLANNVGSATNPNIPFNVPALKHKPWAVLFNAIENDTFLVSNSWLDTTTVPVNRWIVTPPISNITANTVLTWRAKSADANFPENYYVYGTALTGTLLPSSFTTGDQLFFTSTENGSWTRRSVSLGAFAGQTLRFAFRNLSLDKFQLWLDDIEVVTVANNIDAALGSIDAQKYVLVNTSDTVKVNLSNLGAATINNITLNYTIGNSSVNSQVFSYSSGLAYQQNNLNTFPLPYSVSVAGNYKLKVWVSSVNNAADQNHLNDTVSTYITVQSTAPKKLVLVEQFVNAFDGECSDAAQKLLALQNDSVIVVNVHDLDSLKEPNSTALISTYKKNTATAVFDRTYFSYPGSVVVSRPYYNNLVAKRLKSISPASVTIINKTYNSATKQLFFTVKADFIGDVKGDLRLNAYLTENNVHGPWNDTTVNGFNQLNNYYNVPWSAFYQAGYYSSTYDTHVLYPGQFMHENTLVHSFDGSFGNAGLIPTTGGTQNQSYQQTYSITIPTQTNNVVKFNADNMYIIGFLAEYNTDPNQRSILNVVKEKITSNSETVGLKEVSDKPYLSVYPNPSAGKLYINSSKEINTYEIKVIDLTGRCIKLENLIRVGNIAPIDLSQLNNGIYFVAVSSENGSFIEKIVIQKN